MPEEIERKMIAKDVLSDGMTQDGNIIRFVASKEIIDRDGDIIYVDGIDTKNFAKNPLFLWGHDTSRKPIGKIVNLEKSTGLDGIKQLNIAVEFYGSEEAQEIRDMYVNGFLSGVSVRILPKSYEQYKNKDGAWGWKYLTSELLEVSAVTVPANQGALIQKMISQTLNIRRLEKQVGEMKSVYAKISTITETLQKFYAGSEKPKAENRITEISKKLQGVK